MEYEIARHRLVNLLSRDIHDPKTLAAISKISRELFVPPELRHLAYKDEPLPIGQNQTISQPYIVALMTEKLSLTGTEKVLEIGTGSGYQTAILAELAREVHSTERIPDLTEKAAKLLHTLGYKNVFIHAAQEDLGWQPAAPYEAIITTAAAPDVPPILLEQLAIGGRMIIPVGGRWEQQLLKITKTVNGIHTENLGGCRFVSLIGKGAWETQP
ncbi:MAG: protein-L-isoaspartate(D-aspartate) O-methyltransferase [Dehalococcoidales bacterium]|nr:protein-L-isoaspartate(D-aspartate) O-methyltransferase [Dehalococcoidales bacterium]